MFSDLLYRLRALFRRNDMERELDEELRFHLEEQAAKHLRAGKDSTEAARLARLDIAGQEQAKENCRDARGTALLENLLQDLQYGFRQLRKAPGFTAVAVTVLALGIGANTAIFSFLDVVVLQAVPVKDPQQLVVPSWSAKQAPSNFGELRFDACYVPAKTETNTWCSFSYPLYNLIASKSDLFSNVAAFVGPFTINSTATGVAERVEAQAVSGNFFRTLGVTTALGRPLEPSSDLPGAPSVVVLSYEYWQKATASDPRIIGKVIRLNNSPFEVVGVAQPGFRELSPGRPVSVWIPIHTGVALGMHWYRDSIDSDHEFWLRVIGRVHPDVSTRQLETELTRVFALKMIDGSKLLPPGSKPVIHISSAVTGLVGVREYLAKPIYVAMCGVGLILLIACANVATLLTARAAGRQREIAIRLALGAGRPRIVRQLLTESLLLAVLGGSLGLALAHVASRALSAEMLIQVRPNLHLLLFATLVSLGSGILFGLVPAWQSTRVQAAAAFTSGQQLQTAMSSARRQLTFRHSLIVVQVAVSAVVLAGSALFVQTLRNLTSTAIGFNPSQLLVFGLDPASSGYKPAAIPALYQEIADRLRALPGTQNVTYSSDTLVAGSSHSSRYHIDGESDQKSKDVFLLGIGPDFLQTMRIPLLAGRSFTAIELAQDRPVAVVNREFVRRYLPDGKTLGRRFGDTGPTAVRYVIVGVIGNTKYQDLRETAKPIAYMPFQPGRVAFEVRSDADPARLKLTVENLVHKIDRNLPIFPLQTQVEAIDQTLSVERLLTQLSSIFGILALALTSVGLYGLLSYEVARRTREIGIRIAIGAQARQVQQMVLRQTLLVVFAGLLIGSVCSLAATRLLATFLYGVKPGDPGIFACVIAVLFTVSVLASYLPTRRASRIDPAIALRYE